MKTNKSFISKANKKSGDAPPSSKLSVESPTTHKNNSDGANIPKHKYMRRKDIKEILKEEETKEGEKRNDTRR